MPADVGAAKRSITEWLAFIEAMHPEVIELGLDRIRRVAARLDLLDLPGQIITVAGTNGKGSTIALLNALAQGSGLTTSVYTSPHLLHFNERICRNGVPADDAALCDAFTAVENARGDTHLTYFEFTTLVAFWLFKQQPTDLYLLEIGLGGRLDAVNLLDADVAVITSIGLDHTDWLGDTRDAIGREKAGIARAQTPLIYGELDMPDSIAEVATEKQASLLRAGDRFGYQSGKKHVYWDGRQVTMPNVVLGGDNLATALQALACLAIQPDDQVIETVAASCQLPGRCEIRQIQGHNWLFDVGHNREALARVARRLPSHQGRTLALVAMLRDKPAEAVLSLVDQVDEWFAADLPGPRGGGVTRFGELLPKVQTFTDVETALSALKAVLQPGDRVLVLGSFVTVSTVWQLLQQEAC